MQIIDCNFDDHAAEILAILNEAIVNSTALYDYVPRSAESMVGWFAAKTAEEYPVIGALSETGALFGFASYGAFRNWPAYKYSIESSIYVHPDHRGKGIARQLMQALIQRAQQQHYHLMIGAIDNTNAASIGLHAGLGFKHAGTITHAGFKFGRWLDLALYQLTLETPAHPFDGFGR